VACDQEILRKIFKKCLNRDSYNSLVREIIVKIPVEVCEGLLEKLKKE